MKFLNNLFVEIRRIRWSNLSTTTRTFISSIVFIIIAMIILVFFSWAVTEILNLL